MYSLFGSRQTRILLVHLVFAFCALFALADRVSVTLLSFRSVAYPPVVWPNGTWICFNISFRCLHFILCERERESFAGTSLKSAQKARKLFLFRFVVVFFSFIFLLPCFSHANAALHFSFVVDFYAHHNSRNGHWFDFASPPSWRTKWSLPRYCASIIGTRHPPITRCAIHTMLWLQLNWTCNWLQMYPSNQLPSAPLSTLVCLCAVGKSSYLHIIRGKCKLLALALAKKSFPPLRTTRLICWPNTK